MIGMVAPKSLSGNKNSKIHEAVRAPNSCAIIYFGTSIHLNLLATAKPRVTAGLKCAPEISPKAYIIDITMSPHVMATPG